MSKSSKARTGASLDELRARGMKVDGFAEGYREREAVIHAGEMVRNLRQTAVVAGVCLA